MPTNLAWQRGMAAIIHTIVRTRSQVMTLMSPNGRMKTGRQAAVSRHKRPPERTCVGCRQTHPKSQLIRLVCGVNSQLMMDRQGKLPGRGVYVCPQRSCVEIAVKG